MTIYIIIVRPSYVVYVVQLGIKSRVAEPRLLLQSHTGLYRHDLGRQGGIMGEGSVEAGRKYG